MMMLNVHLAKPTRLHVPTHTKSIIVLTILVGLLISRTNASLVCEELPMELCAYSVSSMGVRCVLEGEALKENTVVYKCQTSNVMANSSAGWIETDDCIEACGLSRMTEGISSDALSDARILPRLCSQQCRLSCPDLFHLHQELAVEEGNSMDNICMSGHDNPGRVMGEFPWKSKGNHERRGHRHCKGFACGHGHNGGFALPPATSPNSMFEPGCHGILCNGDLGRRFGWGRDKHPKYLPFHKISFPFPFPQAPVGN